MAKKRRRVRRIRLGDPAAVHSRKLEATIDLMNDFVAQGRKYLNNNLCTVSVQTLVAAAKAVGESHGHRSGATTAQSQRLIAARTAVQRFERDVLANCTRDD
jgi:hypothetical protein